MKFFSSSNAYSYMIECSVRHYAQTPDKTNKQHSYLLLESKFKNILTPYKPWPCEIMLTVKTPARSQCLIAKHRGFLEHWNSQKSVCNIWERFSCQLDEGIPKICKKLNSHDGFLSYLQNSTANSAHLAAHFCPALVSPQKVTVRIQFLPSFWNPPIK